MEHLLGKQWACSEAYPGTRLCVLQVADPEVEDIAKPFGAQEISSGVPARCDGYGTARVGVVPAGFWCCIALTRPCYSLLFSEENVYSVPLYSCTMLLVFDCTGAHSQEIACVSGETLHLYFQH